MGFRLAKKPEGMTGCIRESELCQDGECEEGCVQDEVNQEESEQNGVDGTKKGVDSTGKVMHI